MDDNTAPPAPPAPPPPPPPSVLSNQSSSSSSSTAGGLGSAIQDKLESKKEKMKMRNKSIDPLVVLPWAESTEGKRAVRIVVISDTHSQHTELVLPAGDILVHCGDFSDHGTADEVAKFNAWLGQKQQQAFSHRLVICGNHEEELVRTSMGNSDTIAKALNNAIYLQDKIINIMGINFYGTPWNLSNMAFGLGYDKINSKWSKIPKETDILITHNPPFNFFIYKNNILDLAHVGKRGKIKEIKKECEFCGNEHPLSSHWGCRLLADRVLSLSPKVHLFGHVHDEYGSTQQNGITYINAACDIGHTAFYFDVFPDILHPSSSEKKKKKKLFGIF